MREDEVPQETNSTLDGNRKALYAIDKGGKYITVASEGWSAEEIVTNQAIEEFERLAKDALERANRGDTSLLEYYMYKNRMDLALLSQTTGFFRWTIKRDFKPSIFNKISDKRAMVYADIFGMRLNELKNG